MKSLFHIRRIGTFNADRFLSAGETIYIEGMNSYSRYLWEESLLTNSGRVRFPMAAMARLSELGQYQLHKAMSQRLCKQLVEYVFEGVRREHFSLLPSRRTCIFATSSEQSAKKWRDSFGPCECYQVLEIEVLPPARIFEADANLVCYDTLPMIQIESFAQHYWNGQKTQNLMTEFLIEGSARVRTVIENIGESQIAS